MISWRGHGLLIIIMGAFALVLARAILPPIDTEPGKTLMVCIHIAISGLAVWFLGYALNKEKILFNEADQQYYRHKNQHSVYGIPVQYFGLANLLASVLFSLPLDNWLITASLLIIDMAAVCLVLLPINFKKQSP